MVKKIFIHLSVILTAMMITLIILNYLNPLMGFLSRGISKAVIILWIAALLITIILCLLSRRGKTSQNT